MILDVGCGAFPKGDVNVDLYASASIHRGYEVNPRRIENFIIADGHHLPFKNSAFNEVVSYHVIEHIEKPMRFLSEMVRVSSHKVVVCCPHRFCLDRNKSHINKFGCKWFKQAFKLLGLFDAGVKVNYGLFGIPSEIEAIGVKFL